LHGSSPLSPEHEGSVVSTGIKYVLRSDVMFRAEQQELANKKKDKCNLKQKRKDKLILHE